MSSALISTAGSADPTTEKIGVMLLSNFFTISAYLASMTRQEELLEH
jgi:hypothetical protein